MHTALQEGEISSLFDQNNCPIKVLKGKKSFPVRLPLMLLLLTKKRLLSKKVVKTSYEGQNSNEDFQKNISFS